ncbi:MAG TPA: hypothetical protein DCQ06_03845 [Myxococcales bacterium]|nr:hypothetical protein [Myxococcales bacterium]HAN30707.1 hypothetical protein [Myxococcales bacterium]
MNHYFQSLLARPNTPPTRLSLFTERCGYFYAVLGFSFLFAPNAQAALGLLPPFSGQEEGLYRLIGLALGFIGYFYIFGGRGQSKTFGLATVLDRLVVPFLGLYIYLSSSIEVMIVLPLCIIDPILGATAYWLWRKDEADAQG